MCTVSFVPLKDVVIITSNRDEHIQRKNAAAPAFHVLNNKKIIFPKDQKAGGTWLAAGDHGAVAVLLNGAFKKHIPQPPYRKSRGLILLEIIGADIPLIFFGSLDLENIEAFTIVLFQGGNLYELRWDGNNKHAQKLDNSGNYIWSSVTLYREEVIQSREKLFEQFVMTKKNIDAQLIRDFHGDDHGDDENGFVINRQTGMKTFSITQAVVKTASIHFLHTDLLQHHQFEEIMNLKQGQ
ncbi:MAG: NRDE family protein [Ferruginibacter sp.]